MGEIFSPFFFSNPPSSPLLSPLTMNCMDDTAEGGKRRERERERGKRREREKEKRERIK